MLFVRSMRRALRPLLAAPLIPLFAPSSALCKTTGAGAGGGGGGGGGAGGGVLGLGRHTNHYSKMFLVCLS